MADCEWNPVEKRPVFNTDPAHGLATWSVGTTVNWRLCDQCAALPEFARYRRRHRLQRREKPRIQMLMRRQWEFTYLGRRKRDSLEHRLITYAMKERLVPPWSNASRTEVEHGDRQ